MTHYDHNTPKGAYEFQRDTLLKQLWHIFTDGREFINGEDYVLWEDLNQHPTIVKQLEDEWRRSNDV